MSVTSWNSLTHYSNNTVSKMSSPKQDLKFRHLLAPQLSAREELQQYEVSFRRWLGRQLHSGAITNQQAIDELGLTRQAVVHIRKLYLPQVALPLPAMTEAEQQQLETLQQRVTELERQLEDAEIRNITLETLVDVAEQQFKIPIRKKPGAKQ